jgi:diadenosine tetraphosphatase ApaH/serine/threonine PP2A family protein phosphatase
MRVLILSDIHGNLEALQACLAHAPERDLVVNLGDIVGYGASPNEVTARSRDLGGLIIRGNHDKACTGLMEIDDFNPIATAAALWTREALEPENLEWLKALPAGPRPVEQVPGVQCVHGSPLDEDEYLVVMRDAVEPLEEVEVPLTFFGHTHIQGGFSLIEGRGETLRPFYEARDKAESFELGLEREGRYLINPGSVGQPRDGDWRAAFAIFDVEEWGITFYRVPYYIEGAQQRIREAGLPERLASRLSDGR